MNSRNILLLLPFTITCLQAAQYDYTKCRRVLTEIKAGAPYQNQDAATLVAATIATNAEKIANDPFVDKNKRTEATRDAACANFFMNAGIYYTYQKELDTFHEKFVEAQKQNANLTKQDYAAHYFSKPEATTPTILTFRAQERERSMMASPEEKAIGTLWKSVFQAYTKAAAAAVAEKKEPAEKYIK